LICSNVYCMHAMEIFRREVLTVKRMNNWQRMWRNHRRGRSFWNHPKGFWFPQGIPISVIALLLWFWALVYLESDHVPFVGTLIGLVLGLGMLVLELVRLCKNKPEWRGNRRSRSIVSLLSLIAFVVLMGWVLITN
jgi:hypothetical protein